MEEVSQRTSDAVGYGSERAGIQHELIAARAHELWVLRGCPIGSPEQDWFQAEEEMYEMPRLSSHSRAA